jgi:hypothetical protein
MQFSAYYLVKLSLTVRAGANALRTQLWNLFMHRASAMNVPKALGQLEDLGRNNQGSDCSNSPGTF